MNLQTFFLFHPKAALAFSGGVDSAYLLYAAKQMHCDLRAYFVQSQFQPEFELQDAQRFTEQLGIPLTVLPCDILQHPLVVENGPLRCYHCKTALFTALWERARMDGYPLLLDGTNASDRTDDRPGMRALEELEVRSPLRECGLTKADIRSLSKEAGLFTWDKPAYACLATRIPTGTSITAEQLEHIERSEQALSSLGFSDLRVRIENGSACLELPHPQFIRAVQLHQEIRTALSPYFKRVLLNLAPRD